MTEERLYSITEAAQKLGVSPATIATWIRLGIARASRQDELGRNRYTNADLVEMEQRFQERQARKRGSENTKGARGGGSRVKGPLGQNGGADAWGGAARPF